MVLILPELLSRITVLCFLRLCNEIRFLHVFEVSSMVKFLIIRKGKQQFDLSLLRPLILVEVVLWICSSRIPVVQIPTFHRSVRIYDLQLMSDREFPMSVVIELL